MDTESMKFVPWTIEHAHCLPGEKNGDSGYSGSERHPGEGPDEDRFRVLIVDDDRDLLESLLRLHNMTREFGTGGFVEVSERSAFGVAETSRQP